ncbi:MAG: hypothetical protein JNN13_01485 [Planctomycetes bacterium]|nr:hypothetical protein [Planctomycetota bacterium]
MSEVFVVDRSAFFRGDWPQGFTPLEPAEAWPFLQRAFASGRFEPRAIAEATPAWKQWIPYCALRCQPAGAPGADQTGVLLVQRTSGQSEARLHGAWSIGLGGHIEPVDAEAPLAGPDFFAASLWRELTEELHLDLPPMPPRLVGLINDDATEVGRVHAGLAYVLDLPLTVAEANRRVQVREISKMRGGFAHLVELQRLWQDAARFESWSRFLIRAEFLCSPGGDSSSRPWQEPVDERDAGEGSRSSERCS